MNKKHTRFVALVIVIAMVVTSFSFIMFLPGLWGAENHLVYAGTAEEEAELGRQLSQLGGYIEYIRENYKDEVDYKLLMDGAFSGVVNVLGDPYSVYYEDKLQSDTIQEDISGIFSGIGVHINSENSKCTVISAIRNTPADRAGIRTGDVIVKVDDQGVSEKTLAEIAAMLKGEEGTQVKVTIERSGRQMDFTLTRALVGAESVAYEMLDGDIGYITISSFDADTDVEFKMAKIALVNKGAVSMIIDVRNNPGGLVDTAVGVANEILDKGTITSFEQQGKTIKTFEATETGSLPLPIVLLINEGSASASEILAGALKENGAATLVGTTTYGKGIAQQFANLKSGGSVKLSICYFLTPDGNDIHKVGISPDHTVRNTSEEDTKALKETYQGFAPMTEDEKPKAGDTGLNVYGAQQRLEFLGFRAQASGTMDDATVEAVKAFQKEEGLSPYGVLDYTTMSRLETAAHDYAYGVSEEDNQLKQAIEILN